jgi:hypothetical protein
LYLGSASGDRLGPYPKQRPRGAFEPPVIFRPSLSCASFKIDSKVLEALGVFAEKELADRPFGTRRLTSPPPIGGPLIRKCYDLVFNVRLSQTLP